MRFTLLSLMLFTTAAAVLCGIFFALPEGVDVMVLCAMTLSVLPAASIAGIVYGRGYARAFSIGCISSMGWIISIFPIFFVLGSVAAPAPDLDATSLKIVFAVLFLTMGVCGFIAMGVRWLCLRTSKRSSIATMSQTSPTMLIDPRDKAELYAILQGRLNGASSVPAADGASPLS